MKQVFLQISESIPDAPKGSNESKEVVAESVNVSYDDMDYATPLKISQGEDVISLSAEQMRTLSSHLVTIRGLMS